MGRTVPPWRMVVESMIAKTKRFRQLLPSDDRVAFDELMNSCRIYASYASTMASPVPEVPLLMSMLFSQHKRIMDLEKRLVTLTTETNQHANARDLNDFS